MIKISMMVSMAALGLTACGAATIDDQPVTKVDYSKLQYSPQTETSLKVADKATLESQVKNGIRLQLRQFSQSGGPIDASIPTASPSVPVAGPTSQPFSQTNVHVAGVDEADLVKYDGQHWYMAGQQPGTNFSFLRIAQAGPDASAAAITGEYALDVDTGTAQGLYQIPAAAQPADPAAPNPAKEIAVLAAQRGNIYGFYNIGQPIALPAIGGAAIAPPYFRPVPVNSTFIMQWVDVQDAKHPKASHVLKIDGTLVNSRKVGDVVYVVTRFDPWLPTLNPVYGVDAAAQSANEKLLADAPIEELLPQYAFNGEAKKPLATKCLLPLNVDKTYGLDTVVNLTAIDLVTKKVLSSSCVNANLSQLQVTPTAAYLTADYRTADGANILIHKFSLAGTSYLASGTVAGSFDGGDVGFRLNEDGDYLRLLTTVYDGQNQPAHKLTVLKQTATQLSTVATLPNPSKPAPIGKPGERIYGARFIDDRAYVVTFRRTDPLYVIDLADNTNPSIAGELEIPGFATYIHPVGKNHLFTLGNSGDAKGLVNGIKVELLNVATLGAPKVVDTIAIGGLGTGSEALYDLHALSFLQATADQLRISFPLQVYGENYQWQNTGLQLLEINGLAGNNPRLRKQGSVIIENSSATKTYPQKFGQIRGLLHGDAVYVAQDANVWAANWQTPGTVIGPFSAALTACPALYIPSATLTLTAPGADACKATVMEYGGDRSSVIKGEPGSNNSCIFRAYLNGGNVWLTASLYGYNMASTVVRSTTGCQANVPISLTLTPGDKNYPVPVY